MNRPADGRASKVRPLAAWLIATILVAACEATATPSLSAPVASPRTTPIASASRPAETATSTPNPTPGPPFDPATISVTLEPVAAVAGAPLAFAAPPDGSGRLFVAAKDGRVWILEDGSVAPEPVLDLRALVSTGGEQGLLGIAIHPSFPVDPRVFIDYTDVTGDTVVASYRISASDPDRLDPASEQRILTADQPFANHNGGAVVFGPDGMLYVSFGDGGSGGDPLGSGQRLDTLLGKILRLDVSVDGGGAAYAIPADNPFVNRPGARPEIWLTGLRNPWRMAFDRDTGDLWIGDVGQGDWEEIDVARSGVGGLNFGWNVLEGRHCFSPGSNCPTTGLTMPVTEYGHDLGCTVIGGSVYRGSGQPLLMGGYLFADYCSGRLWAIAATSDGPVEPVRIGTAGAGIVAFGEDADGELFAANLDGTVSRIIASRR